MTAAQLINELSKYDPNMDVFVAERKTKFSYGLVNSVYIHTINFKEQPSDEEALAREEVIILDEE